MCWRIAGAALVLAVALLASGAARVTADGPSASRWSVEVTTAPHLPQDVWFAGMGNNADGWESGGSICLNGLAQGTGPGEDVTLLVDVVAGGIFGVDGSPVPAGTYHFPGIEEPDFDYTVTSGKTFYVVVDVYVVQSNLPFFQEGETVQGMYMWDYAPGRTDRHMVLWFDFGFGFVPFLNEGIMMANTRWHP